MPYERLRAQTLVAAYDALREITRVTPLRLMSRRCRRASMRALYRRHYVAS